MLTKEQTRHFREYGYVVIENIIDRKTVSELNARIDQWVDDSRDYAANYGRLIDGQPRFDLEPGHKPTQPKLRRITNPVEISETFRRTIIEGPIVPALAPILGPNIKFDHCKINAKHPGMVSDVKYHQDHIFEPQTNDDVVTTLLTLNDCTRQNGCLKVVPGSHRKRYSHSRNGRFTGEIDPAFSAEFDREAHDVEVPAGSLCIMDTWAVHGSERNRSTIPRRLMITEFKAADAFPLTRHKLPSRFMDAVVLGQDMERPRYRDKLDFEIPEFYEGDSLFQLQEMHTEANQVAIA